MCAGLRAEGVRGGSYTCPKMARRSEGMRKVSCNYETVAMQDVKKGTGTLHVWCRSTRLRAEC